MYIFISLVMFQWNQFSDTDYITLKISVHDMNYEHKVLLLNKLKFKPLLLVCMDSQRAANEVIGNLWRDIYILDYL